MNWIDSVACLQSAGRVPLGTGSAAVFKQYISARCHTRPGMPVGNHHPRLSGYGRCVEKPVQWMTLQELRDELDRTRPIGEALDLDGFLAGGQLPELSKDAHRHDLVANELLRRPSNG